MRYTKGIRIDVWEWHVWFAWHPVQLPTGTWVWLEDVRRKKEMHWIGGSWYNYRPVKSMGD